MNYSDQALIEEIRSGSNLAFEILMRRYERLVYRIAFSYTRGRESALDVTQNVFLRMHRKLGSLRAEGQFRSWLLRIAHNESLNWIRSQRRHDGHEEVIDGSLRDNDPSQEEQLLGKEHREQLLAQILRLNPRHRMAVMLRYFESMSIREIAAVLRCSEGVVKNMLFRSLQKLRGRLRIPMEISS